MPTWQPDLAPLVGRIPRLYSLLRALSEDMHAEIGVTAGMRVVMASLNFGGGRTVPDIARERAVSRQHIQSVINELLLANLVEAVSNPSHRRSRRFILTDEGQRRLRMIGEREARLLTRIAPAISHVELAAATRLFDHLERDLAEQVSERAASVGG
jgi:DNA-binding MarR family transcriptional regulator